MNVNLDKNLVEFTNLIACQFQNMALLKTALTHRSYQPAHKNKSFDHNERLEFLGDAVLELIITDYLFNQFSEDEGYLTSLRASLVNYKSLGEIASEIGLEKYMLLAKGERSSEGEVNVTILADCLEAVIGAVYLDGGLEVTKKFILPKLISKIPDIIEKRQYKDFKTRLQEYSQKHLKETPHYKILQATGKDHDKQFESAVFIQDKIVAKGLGKSKQESETVAAELALKTLILDLKISEEI